MWTRQKPIRAGLYWYRADEHNEQIIVDVFEDDDGMRAAPYTSGSLPVDSDDAISKWNGEWSDAPIPKP